MSKLSSNIGLLELLSSYTDLTSCPSSETNIAGINSLDAVKQSPFARRLILNNLV